MRHAEQVIRISLQVSDVHGDTYARGRGFKTCRPTRRRWTGWREVTVKATLARLEAEEVALDEGEAFVLPKRIERERRQLQDWLGDVRQGDAEVPSAARARARVTRLSRSSICERCRGVGAGRVVEPAGWFRSLRGG
jgi:hypothetical protein